MKKIITDYLNETAVKYPNKVAFATDKEEINYDEFTNKSKSIGTYLAGLETFKQPIAIKAILIFPAYGNVLYDDTF